MVRSHQQYTIRDVVQASPSQRSKMAKQMGKSLPDLLEELGLQTDSQGNIEHSCYCRKEKNNDYWIWYS